MVKPIGHTWIVGPVLAALLLFGSPGVTTATIYCIFVLNALSWYAAVAHLDEQAVEDMRADYWFNLASTICCAIALLIVGQTLLAVSVIGFSYWVGKQLLNQAG